MFFHVKFKEGPAGMSQESNQNRKISFNRPLDQHMNILHSSFYWQKAKKIKFDAWLLDVMQMEVMGT